MRLFRPQAFFVSFLSLIIEIADSPCSRFYYIFPLFLPVFTAVPPPLLRPRPPLPSPSTSSEPLKTKSLTQIPPLLIVRLCSSKPPLSFSSSSAKPRSLLFDPASQSLAVTLPDFSIILFSSFSPSSPLSSPLVSSSACFLLLNPKPNPSSSRPVFLSASPHQPSSVTLLRAWIRRAKSNLFTPVALSFKKRIGRSGGLVLDLTHGFGIKIVGSVNVWVVHSVAESQIRVLGLRMDGGEGDERVELVKCAVIECTLLIYEVKVLMGVLVLGELGGVRVFPLRPMVKGGHRLKTRKRRDLNGLGEGVGEQWNHERKKHGHGHTHASTKTRQDTNMQRILKNYTVNNGDASRSGVSD